MNNNEKVEHEIKQIIDFFNENIGESFSIKQIAKEIDISPSLARRRLENLYFSYSESGMERSMRKTGRSPSIVYCFNQVISHGR